MDAEHDYVRTSSYKADDGLSSGSPAVESESNDGTAENETSLSAESTEMPPNAAENTNIDVKETQKEKSPGKSSQNSNEDKEVLSFEKEDLTKKHGVSGKNDEVLIALAKEPSSSKQEYKGEMHTVSSSFSSDDVIVGSQNEVIELGGTLECDEAMDKMADEDSSNGNIPNDVEVNTTSVSEMSISSRVPVAVQQPVTSEQGEISVEGPSSLNSSAVISEVISAIPGSNNLAENTEQKTGSFDENMTDWEKPTFQDLEALNRMSKEILESINREKTKESNSDQETCPNLPVSMDTDGENEHGLASLSGDSEHQIAKDDNQKVNNSVSTTLRADVTQEEAKMTESCKGFNENNCKDDTPDGHETFDVEMSEEANQDDEYTKKCDDVPANPDNELELPHTNTEESRLVPVEGDTSQENEAKSLATGKSDMDPAEKAVVPAKQEDGLKLQNTSIAKSSVLPGKEDSPPNICSLAKDQEPRDSTDNSKSDSTEEMDKDIENLPTAVESEKKVDQAFEEKMTAEQASDHNIIELKITNVQSMASHDDDGDDDNEMEDEDEGRMIIDEEVCKSNDTTLMETVDSLEQGVQTDANIDTGKQDKDKDVIPTTRNEETESGTKVLNTHTAGPPRSILTSVLKDKTRNLLEAASNNVLLDVTHSKKSTLPPETSGNSSISTCTTTFARSTCTITTSRQESDEGDILDILRPSPSKSEEDSNSSQIEKAKNYLSSVLNKQRTNQVAKKSTTKPPLSSILPKPIKSIQVVHVSADLSKSGKTQGIDSQPKYSTCSVASSEPGNAVIQRVNSNQSQHQNSLSLLSNQVNMMRPTHPGPTLRFRFQNATSSQNMGSFSGQFVSRVPVSVVQSSPSTSNTTQVVTQIIPIGSKLVGNKSNPQAQFKVFTTATLAQASSKVRTIQPKPVKAGISSATSTESTSVPVVSTSCKTNTTTNTEVQVSIAPKSSSQCDSTASDESKKSPSLPLSTINIDSVGLPKITELIARKNPIPIYKAPPLPPNLIGIIDQSSFVCYECGDSFCLEESLEYHKRRYSMKISYKCEDCKSTKTFFNKCQFLNHLRFHLRIDVTKAVPIHIKSDSIAISVLPPWYEQLMLPATKPPKGFSDLVQNDGKELSSSDVPVLPYSNFNGSSETLSSAVEEFLQNLGKDSPLTTTKKLNCYECKHVGSKSLHSHLKTKETECKTFTYACPVCHMVLPSACALSAHRRIHSCQAPAMCPECGTFVLHQGGNMSAMKQYAQHLLFECFHISRVTSINCPKCGEFCSNFMRMRNHILENLDQYLKCLSCPMAFKSANGISKHYIQLHAQESEQNNQKLESQVYEKPHLVNSKYIYRCHICGVVMDDLVVLNDHTNNHLSEMKPKATYSFVCLLCQEVFKTQEDLALHHQKTHNENDDLKKCRVCACFQFKNYMHGVQHYLHHRSIKGNMSTYAPCKICCRVININEIATHPCTSNKCLTSPKCSVCHSVFKKQNEFVAHMAQHAARGVRVCLTCFRTEFNSTEELREHAVKCKKVQFVKLFGNKECFSCGLTFCTKEAYRSHMQNHIKLIVAEGKVNCQFCSSSAFESYTELARHLQQCHSNVKVFKCPECNTTFKSKEEVNAHRKKEHAFSFSNLFPCHLCVHAYENEADLKRHIAVKHEAKRSQFYCRICKKRNLRRSFTSKISLEKHLVIRHRKGSKDLQMEIEMGQVDEIESSDNTDSLDGSIGDKRRSVERETDQPLKKLRVDGENSFNCAKCTFSCSNRKDFLEHLNVHKVENFLQCLECGLSFAVLPTLRKHLFMVHKVKNFEDYCQKNEIDIKEGDELGDIKIVPPENMRMESDHEEEVVVEVTDPLECHVCHRRFDTEALTKAHMRTHGLAFLSHKKQVRSSGNTTASASNGWESSDSSGSSIHKL